MDKKQVVIVALLLIAVVLSTASVMMNVSVLNNVEIHEASADPDLANVKINVLATPENTGGVSNG